MNCNQEQTLIEGIIRKDDTSILQFVKTYENQVYAQAMRLLNNADEAAEVCQDVFLKALNQIERFEKRSKLSTWLYRIAYNTCLDRLKKIKRKPRETELTDANSIAWSELETAVSIIERKEQEDIIANCITSLSEKDALLVEYYYLQEMSTAEIGEITGMKDGAIRIGLMRARKKLALSLSNALPIETLKEHSHGKRR